MDRAPDQEKVLENAVQKEETKKRRPAPEEDKAPERIREKETNKTKLLK